jgi:hypothetical protein
MKSLSTFFAIQIFASFALAISITTPKLNAIVTSADQNAFAIYGACENGIKVKLYVIDSESVSTPVTSLDCKDKKYGGKVDVSSLKDGKLRVKAVQVVNGVSQIVYQYAEKSVGEVAGVRLSPTPSRFASLSSGTAKVSAASMSAAVAAVASASANTIVTLPAGTFSDVDVKFLGNGTSGSKPVIIEGAAGGKTILTGRVRIKLSGKYIQLRNIFFKQVDSYEHSGSAAILTVDLCQYCGIGNIKMDGGPAAKMSGADDLNRHKWIRILATSQNLEVANSSFLNKASGGSEILVERNADWGGVVDGHRIFNNLFSGRLLQGNGANDFDHIRLGASTGAHSPSEEEGAAYLAKAKGGTGTIVEFNVFENTNLAPAVLAACAALNYRDSVCSAEPELISVKSPQNIIRFNTFRNNYGGLTLRHGFQNIAEGNFFSGKNTPQGITAINKFSYGVRIIGADNVVMNNHMEDLYINHEMMAGISLMAGQVNADNAGYWQVRNAIVAMNYISNSTTTSLALAAGYGNTKADKYRILPPQDVVFSNNAITTSGTMIKNQYTDTSYLKDFVIKNFYYQAAAIGMSGVSGKTLSFTTKAISNRGFSEPTNTELVGSVGVLRSTASLRSTLLKDLASLSGGSPAKVVEDLMLNLLIKSGTVYENFSPRLPSEVGVKF